MILGTIYANHVYIVYDKTSFNMLAKLVRVIVSLYDIINPLIKRKYAIDNECKRSI